MPTIPAFMLDRLYVRGSLRNVEGGIEFTLHNNLANATITGLMVQIDAVEVDPASLRVVYEGARMRASEIGEGRPLRFMVNTGVTLLAEGVRLAAGVHRIVVSPTTAELGRLSVNAQDEVA